MVLFLIATACSAPAEQPPEPARTAQELDVVAHRLGWDQLRAYDYTWTYRAGTFWDYHGEITVTVERGRVVDVATEDEGAEHVPVLTVVDSFELARSTLAHEWWHASFDGDTCLPTDMYFDEVADVADDEYSFTLIDFAPAGGPLPPCEPVALTGKCFDRTGHEYRSEQVLGGNTDEDAARRWGVTFLSPTELEYNASDYNEDVDFRCESGALVELDTWARLISDGDGVLVELGRDVFRAVTPITTGSVCDALAGQFLADDSEASIALIRFTGSTVEYVYDNGTRRLRAYECTGESIVTRTERGWFLEHDRLLWDGNFYAPED
jgi:hypothetical protein